MVTLRSSPYPKTSGETACRDGGSNCEEDSFPSSGKLQQAFEHEESDGSIKNREIENLEVVLFSAWLLRSGSFELPVMADFR